MKDAVIPPDPVESELRASLDAVLRPGETLAVGRGAIRGLQRCEELADLLRDATLQPRGGDRLAGNEQLAFVGVPASQQADGSLAARATGGSWLLRQHLAHAASGLAEFRIARRCCDSQIKKSARG
ncbi:hypothetical protein EXH51_19230 [Pelomonas saccharophila]|uniref:hypothetical protein n=1 Tax=Roseateles saccharophilus TaxID=304 RepID=UPI00104FE10E|nr:hypothetical protein [Roseateles saccharophilus]MDG0834870.1 hypothetical protein [Roseateles saccharophilus]